MRFAHICKALYLEPWLIDPAAHAGLVALVESKLTNFDDSAVDISDFVADSPDFSIDSNGVATIPINGPIVKGSSRIERSCGVADVNVIEQQLDEAEHDAEAVMLVMNSPGGTVSGVPELAERISDSPLPVATYVPDMMASAAYYLGAGSDFIAAAPKSANVGSIGVYIPWVDHSERLAKMGVTIDPIVGEQADLKAVGVSPTLSSTHREYLQERVNKLETEFRTFVTDHRDVGAEGMRGQVLFGQDLLDTGLVDYLSNYEDAYDTLLGLIKS